MHKVVEGEVFFWLTLRAVGGADPFNGMWHYPGFLDRRCSKRAYRCCESRHGSRIATTRWRLTAICRLS